MVVRIFARHWVVVAVVVVVVVVVLIVITKVQYQSCAILTGCYVIEEFLVLIPICCEQMTMDLPTIRYFRGWKDPAQDRRPSPEIARIMNQDYEAIKTECLTKGYPWEDPVFPPTDQSLYLSGRDWKQVEWLRPKVSKIRDSLWVFRALYRLQCALYGSIMTHPNLVFVANHFTLRNGFPYRCYA